MANHNSIGAKGEVSFEYFGNAYSLAILPNVANLEANEQLYLSYGPRSNDQLLQYYGFIEVDNPHDVYIMPPIRDWDIDALEQACGRKFVRGRLQLLDNAGLLGGNSRPDNDSDGDENYDNRAPDSLSSATVGGGGVVVNRCIGLDPAVLQALRVLVSSDTEWNDAGQSIGYFSQERTYENEQCARLVALTAIQAELASKPTTIEEDLELWKRMDVMKSLDTSAEERLAIQFRIEKKKLLRETMESLK
jgi:Rubisco LSMT substrate-binding